MDRRQFVLGAAASAAVPGVARAAASKLAVGIIGVGMRGQVHLEELMRRPDVTIAGICDIDPYMIDKALAAVKAAGRPAPKVWTGSPDAWRAMLAKGGLDAVLIVTPWELHAPQAIAAMQAKIAVGCEVVAGITLDDHWAVLRRAAGQRHALYAARKRLLPPRCAGGAQHGAAGVVRRAGAP